MKDKKLVYAMVDHRLQSSCICTCESHYALYMLFLCFVVCLCMSNH